MNNKLRNFRFHYFECEKIVKKHSDKLKNADVLDIGSNVGFFSEAILKNVKCNSIHLFEPCFEYFSLSVSHPILKGCKDTKIYYNNYGLSDLKQNKVLYKSKDNNIGWNTFLTKDPNQKEGFYEYMSKENCRVMRLDDYEIDNIDFIKIDTEGYEHKVIDGGLEQIKKHKPYILVEVGWGINHPEWEKCQFIYNKLFDIGYEKINFTTDTKDILFTPKQ